jgi:ABC-type transporter Mla subunit MlaD
VVDVALDSSDEVVTWNINDSKVTIDASLPTCDGQCADVPTGAINGNLDRIASELSAVMNRAAQLLASAKANLNADQRARNRRDAQRAARKAAEYEALAKSILVKFPAVVKTCPQAPELCVSVDRGVALDSLRNLYANQRNSTMRTVARSYWRNVNRTRRDDSLVKQAKALETEGITELLKLPRVVVECK